MNAPTQVSGPCYGNIVVVCTGNICRSPMAAALLRQRLGADAPPISSAGTAALVGAPADPEAQALLRTRGIDLSSHRARQASSETLGSARLVLTAESRHNDWINVRFPTLRGRVFKLGHWLGDSDILDPFQRSQSAFLCTLEQIDASITSWLTRLVM